MIRRWVSFTKVAGSGIACDNGSSLNPTFVPSYEIKYLDLCVCPWLSRWRREVPRYDYVAGLLTD